MLNNIETSTYEAILLQLGSIGAFFGVIILFIQVILISFSYLLRICSNKETDNNDKPLLSIVTIFYLITGIAICTLILSTRTNLITRTKLNDFNEKQCNIGYYGIWILSSINRSLFYWIIIRRCVIEFKSSEYKISSVTIIFYYWVLAVMTAISWSILQLSQHNAYWSLIVDNANISVFCVRKTENMSILIYSLHGICVICNSGLQGLLFYLFVSRMRRLYDLDREAEGNNNDDNECIKMDQIYTMMLKLGILTIFLIITTTILLILSVTLFHGIEPFIWICWEIMINSLCLLLHSRIIALFFYVSKMQYHVEMVRNHHSLVKQKH